VDTTGISWPSHANNKVNEKGLNITVGDATTDVDVFMRIQVTFQKVYKTI
jgi:hypothetical protein